MNFTLDIKDFRKAADILEEKGLARVSDYKIYLHPDTFKYVAKEIGWTEQEITDFFTTQNETLEP